MKIRFTLKFQKKALQIRYKTVPKSFRKKSVLFYKRYRFVSDPFDINSFYTEIAKKSITNSLQKRSFQIRLTFGTAEYASWEI
jgi:hypothetical protein